MIGTVKRDKLVTLTLTVPTVNGDVVKEANTPDLGSGGLW